jgi:hypothetical protein
MGCDVTLVEKLWDELDRTYALLKDKYPKNPRVQGECAGLARALAIMCIPLTYDQIRAEAQRRYEEPGRPIPEPHKLERRY